jgi:hypothetical protein
MEGRRGEGVGRRRCEGARGKFIQGKITVRRFCGGWGGGVDEEEQEEEGGEEDEE